MRYKVTSPPSAAATRVVSVQRPCNKHFQKKENNKLLPVPRQREPPLRCRGCWRGRSPGPSAARPPRPAHQQPLVLRTGCMFVCTCRQVSSCGLGAGPGQGAEQAWLEGVSPHTVPHSVHNRKGTGTPSSFTSRSCTQRSTEKYSMEICRFYQSTTANTFLHKTEF